MNLTLPAEGGARGRGRSHRKGLGAGAECDTVKSSDIRQSGGKM